MAGRKVHRECEHGKLYSHPVRDVEEWCSGPEPVGNVQKVFDAWEVPGPSPGYHEHMKGKLRREWPTLAAALDDIHGDEFCDNPDCCDRYEFGGE